MGDKIASKSKFDLVLGKTIKGTPVLANPECSFSYDWDFDRNMGLAYLESIKNTSLNLTLHPVITSYSIHYTKLYEMFRPAKG